MASEDTPKTTLLAGNPISYELPAAAGSALVPGMLARRNSAGTIEAHGTAAGAAEALFIRELSFAGLTIDDVYEPADTVPFWACRKGDHIYAFLEIGANVAIGAQLESNGAGYLQAVTGNFPVVVALEAVDNSAGSDPARIKVEVL